MMLFQTVLLFSTIDVVYLQPMVKNSNNYGPYTLSIDNYKDCKGPKATNLTVMATEMNAHTLVGYVNYTFLVDARLDEIKVQLYNVKDNKKNFLWNYKLTDPCKHFSVAVLIKQHLNGTNCIVKKGNYSSEINFGQAVHSFIGDSFFYGTYVYKADVTSKKGNIACFYCTATYKRKY